MVGHDNTRGKQALVRYVLRPPLAQQRLELLDNGLCRLSLKRAFSDGTVSIELLKRSFDIDLRCTRCHATMKLKSFLTSRKSLQRLLTQLGEPTQVKGKRSHVARHTT